MTLKRRFLLLTALALGLASISSIEPLCAQKKQDDHEYQLEKIEWRTDYYKARKEMSDKGLPIAILFYQDASPPCARIRQSMEGHVPLRKFMNSRTIPLGIQGNKVPELSQTLQISLYPTLVFADRDGKILSTKVGYQDPDELLKHLQRTFPEPK